MALRLLDQTWRTSWLAQDVMQRDTLGSSRYASGFSQPRDVDEQNFSKRAPFQVRLVERRIARSHPIEAQQSDATLDLHLPRRKGSADSDIPVLIFRRRADLFGRFRADFDQANLLSTA
jgi:hypothetical protein